MLRQLQLPPITRSRLETCLRLIDEFSLEIVIAEREIYQTIQEDQRVSACYPFLVSARSSPPPSWPRSATSVVSLPPTSSAPGLV
jgi:hypothetical protein